MAAGRPPRITEVTHQLSGITLAVQVRDVKSARAAWKIQEPLVIERDTYIIEIPKDSEMEDPTNMILDGADYIHLA